MLNVKAETNMAEQPLEEAISLGQSDVGGSTKMLKWKVLHTNRKPIKCPEPYCFKNLDFRAVSANTRSKCIRGKSYSNVLKKVASKHSNSSVTLTNTD